jgi:hypothetical protein
VFFLAKRIMVKGGEFNRQHFSNIIHPDLLPADIIPQLVELTTLQNGETQIKYSCFVEQLIYHLILKNTDDKDPSTNIEFKKLIVNTIHIDEWYKAIINDDRLAEDKYVWNNHPDKYPYNYNSGNDLGISYRDLLTRCLGTSYSKPNLFAIEFILNIVKPYIKTPVPLRISSWFDPYHIIDYYKKNSLFSSEIIAELYELLKPYHNPDYYLKTTFLSYVYNEEYFYIDGMQIGRTGYKYEQQIDEDQILLSTDLRSHNELITYEYDKNTDTLIITRDYVATSLAYGNTCHYERLVFPASVKKVEFIRKKTSKEKDQLLAEYKIAIGYVPNEIVYE